MLIGAEAERGQHAGCGDLRLNLAGVSVLDLDHLAVGKDAIELRGRAVRGTVEIAAAHDRTGQRSGGIQWVRREIRGRRVGCNPDASPTERVGSLRLWRSRAERPRRLRARRGERHRRRLASCREQPDRDRDRRRQIHAGSDQRLAPHPTLMRARHAPAQVRVQRGTKPATAQAAIERHTDGARMAKRDSGGKQTKTTTAASGDGRNAGRRDGAAGGGVRRATRADRRHRAGEDGRLDGPRRAEQADRRRPRQRGRSARSTRRRRDAA